MSYSFAAAMSWSISLVVGRATDLQDHCVLEHQRPVPGRRVDRVASLEDLFGAVGELDAHPAGEDAAPVLDATGPVLVDLQHAVEVRAARGASVREVEVAHLVQRPVKPGISSVIGSPSSDSMHGAI